MKIGFLFAIASALIFSTKGIILKMGAESIPPMTMGFYRFFIAFLFLLVTVPFFDKKAFKTTKKERKEYAFIGFFLGLAGQMYTLGFYHAPVQNVVLLNYLYPFFSLLLGAWVLKEQITRTKIITLVIAIIGMVIINPMQSGSYVVGNTISLINALIFALLVVSMRKSNKNHGIGDILWFFGFASLFLLPMPFIFGWGNISNVWPWVLGLGIFSTGMAYLFLNLSLQKIEASISSVIDLIVSPILAILLALMVLGEPVESRVIIGGGILVLAGAYMELHTLYEAKKLKKSVVQNEAKNIE